MKTSDYLNTEARLNVAGAENTGVGMAMLKACRGERERCVAGLMTDARLNTERIEDDIRFHLGMIRGLEFLDRLRECARRELGMPVDE